jgi:hypothetical protein
MAGDSVFLGLIGAAFIAYLFFYVYNRAYLNEYFQSGSGGKAAGSAYNSIPPRTQIETTTTDNAPEMIVYPGVADVKLTENEVPYATRPIEEVDDYEYNMVFENESNTAISRKLREKLMRQYPMDWSNYPPSSSQFQAGLKESFQNASQDVPDDAKPYQNISGSTMAPPDMSALEKEERKILQTYQPDFPPTATTYDERDARKLIKKMYDAKGLIADVKHKEGTNVYEIVGTRRKNEKVVYEDEAAPVNVDGLNESIIQAPFSTNELTTENRDKFYESNQLGSANPWKYTAWTPGLERVFAPSGSSGSN